jgi:hypothetical protein
METSKLKSILSESNQFANVSIGEKEIGFRLNRENSFTFYWFNVIGEDVFFSHKYSQNTGKQFKSFRSAWGVLEKIGYFN